MGNGLTYCLCKFLAHGRPDLISKKLGLNDWPAAKNMLGSNMSMNYVGVFGLYPGILPVWHGEP